MAIFSATLDANVLVPIALADTLLRCAEKMLFRPIWSARILNEVEGAVGEIHRSLPPHYIADRTASMNRAFPGALTNGFEHIELGLALPDPDDAHVLAAAIHSHSDAIVTANLADFPADYIATFGIEVKSPDDFLLDQLDMASAVVVDALREQAGATRNPSRDLVYVLGALGRAGVPSFADEVARRL